MDSIKAFAMGRANRAKDLMVFDWVKAAKIIKERGAEYAAAGLSGDWGNTGGAILEDGKPIPSDASSTYLASTWATPELEIDGDIIDCYLMQAETPGWDSGTFWPEEALKILAE